MLVGCVPKAFCSFMPDVAPQSKQSRMATGRTLSGIEVGRAATRQRSTAVKIHPGSYATFFVLQCTGERPRSPHPPARAF